MTDKELTEKVDLLASFMVLLTMMRSNVLLPFDIKMERRIAAKIKEIKAELSLYLPEEIQEQ